MRTGALSVTCRPSSSRRAEFRQGGGNEGSDNWGAYRAERDDIIGYLRERRIANNAVLTGNIHTSWACDVVEDPITPFHVVSTGTGAPGYDPVTGLGSAAVEFVRWAVPVSHHSPCSASRVMSTSTKPCAAASW